MGKLPDDWPTYVVCFVAVGPKFDCEESTFAFWLKPVLWVTCVEIIPGNKLADEW